MEARYLEQSRLVVDVLPFVAQEPQFALKGGTAINIFERDLPRLSVDIDLTFLPLTDRDTAIHDINAALTREDRERIVAFTALEADADVFGIPGLERLPAIIWKRRNLETLRRMDAKKFADNVLALERMLL